MTTLFKKAAITALVALSFGMSAHAADYSRSFDIGLVSESHGQVVATTQGSFSDLFTFSVLHNIGASISAQGITVRSLGTSLDSIQLYAGSFTSLAALVGATLLSTSAVETSVKGIRTADNLYLDFDSLPPKTDFTMVINGTAATTYNSHYTTLIELSPAPEPETYAMLLAGLGLTGFIARRRQKSVAA
jgi:hypothetical protein